MPIITERLRPPYRPRIVAETDAFVVIDKPPFLQAHPTRPGDSGTLWDELRALFAYEVANGGQVSLINRLDRETSGLTLVAKQLAAARNFSMRMMERAFEKEYLAIVFGWTTEAEWRVEAPLLRQGRMRPSPVWVKQCVHQEGAFAATRFRTEQCFEREGRKFSLVRAFPETGRMHQIRVHLAESGHPIVGDKLYLDETCYLEFIETGWTPKLAEKLLLSRQALHATRLAVGEWDWQCPLPPDLAEWISGTSLIR